VSEIAWIRCYPLISHCLFLKYLLLECAIYGTIYLVQTLRSSELESWLAIQSAKIKALIEVRIFRIDNYDHFGDAKHLGDGLSELRWKNGLRVYFARVGSRAVLLLNGGGKNDQKKDIKKARLLLGKYTSS